MNLIRHVILGLFFFITLVLLGVVTIYLGDFQLKGRTTELVAYFEDVDGIGPGDPVLLYGKQLGRIYEVDFTEGNPPKQERLFVRFKIEEAVTVRRDYVVAIGSPTLLGGKQLDVELGTGELLPPDQYDKLRGRPPSNLMRQLGVLIGESGEDLRLIARNLRELVQGVNQGERSLASVMLDKQTNADLNSAVASGKNILGKLDTGEGSFGKAINSAALHDSIVSFMGEGGTLFKDAREKQGLVNLLVYDVELREKFKSGIGGLSDAADRIRRGEGILGKLTSAESEATWAEIQSLVHDTSEGRGAIGRLFRDPVLDEKVVNVVTKFSGIADDFAVLADGMRRGRGVAGLLFTDDQARRTAERILDGVARAIEDAREAAPVSSIASFLFGQL